MNTIKIINGQQYSREEFEGYKYRAKFQFEVKGQSYYDNMDIYTTETDRDKVFEVINSRKKEIVEKISLVNFSTKEQDDRMSELIDKTLKDL